MRTPRFYGGGLCTTEMEIIMIVMRGDSATLGPPHKFWVVMKRQRLVTVSNIPSAVKKVPGYSRSIINTRSDLETLCLTL